jgi:hypothetical protein
MPQIDNSNLEEYWFEGEPIKTLLTPQTQQNQQGNFFVFFDMF